MSAFRCIVPAMLFLLAACAPAPQKQKPVAPDLSGDWVLTTTSPVGVQDADMTVRQNGGQLSGKLVSPQGPIDYVGTLEGSAVKFNFTFDAGGQPLKIEYSGVVAGDTMSGKAAFGPLSEGTFTAKRKRP
jgi:hypothetical protein